MHHRTRELLLEPELIRKKSSRSVLAANKSSEIQLDSLHPILKLQQHVGNQAVLRQLNKKGPLPTAVQRDLEDEFPALMAEEQAQAEIPGAEPELPDLAPDVPEPDEEQSLSPSAPIDEASVPSAKDDPDRNKKNTYEALQGVRNVRNIVKNSETLASGDKDKIAAPFMKDTLNHQLSGMSNVKSAVGLGHADIVSGWVKTFADFVGKIPGITAISGLLISAYKVYDAYSRRKAFESAQNAVSENGDGAALSPDKKKFQQATIYAYNKTNRAFWWHVAHFFSSLVAGIMHILTVVTGGASALGTESAALALSIAQSAARVGRKLKGVWKYFTGRRGENRRQNATVVYNAARTGDKAALNLLVQIKPFGILQKVKGALPLTASLPDNPVKMLAYLESHASPKEQRELILEIADKMKSQ